PLRLVGGVAIWCRASSEARHLFGREFDDLDLVAHKRMSRPLRDLLEADGYVPERVFNATHGASRLLYHSADGSYQVDIFLDVFKMSHTLHLGDRIEVETPTLPAADLLLTKLQIAELNRKDASDTLMLLWNHDLAEQDGPHSLNVRRVCDLCGSDWGLFTTINDNLGRTRTVVDELELDSADRSELVARIDRLIQAMTDAPKTAKWKVRARVGRRVRWYEVPEEVVR
ncbi:MAG: hypothetical protein M3P18_11515, partial [Actinomycetota bacterium]|nr:hypothetical protein [Actinomycetota bacterium]